MARQIIKTDKVPKEVKVGDQSVWICMCGLSQNQPFCDKSHKATEDELDGVIYVYDENDNKVGAYDPADLESDESGCCGGGCCGNGNCCNDKQEDCCGQNCENKECCNEECSCDKK